MSERGRLDLRWFTEDGLPDDLIPYPVAGICGGPTRERQPVGAFRQGSVAGRPPRMVGAGAYQTLWSSNRSALKEPWVTWDPELEPSTESQRLLCLAMIAFRLVPGTGWMKKISLCE